MCVLYFKLFAVYRRNAEAYVYIAAYQRFIDLGVRVFFDGDIYVRVAFQISVNDFSREKISGSVGKAKRYTVLVAVFFRIYFREDSGVAVYKILRVAQQYHAVICQRDRRI